MTITEREKQIMELAERGLTDQGIANELGISTATVNSYWVRIRGKLGHMSRTELVATMIKRRMEAQIAELKGTVSMLRQELEAACVDEYGLGHGCREFIDSMPEPVLLVDEERTIVMANAAARELLGYGAEELDGVALERVVPARYRRAHEQHVSSFLHHPARREMGDHLETNALAKSGEEVPICATLSSLQTARGVLAICLFEDARKRHARVDGHSEMGGPSRRRGLSLW